MQPEAKFYKELKKNIPSIIWNRVENLSLLGMPDLLGYNKKQCFFTVELKVVKGNKIKFSPHQIAWHKTHPQNTFIMAKALDPCTLKTSSISLFHGSSIMALARYGMKVDACACGFPACASMFDEVGLTLENLGA